MNVHTSLHAHDYLSLNECFTMWHTQIRQRLYTLVNHEGSQANTPQFCHRSVFVQKLYQIYLRDPSARKRTLRHKDAKFNLSHLRALIPLTSLFSRMLILMISRAIIKLIGMVTRDPPGALLY